MQQEKAATAAGLRRVRGRTPALLLCPLLAFGGAAPAIAAFDYEPFHVGAIEVIPDFNTRVTPTGSVLLPNGAEQSAELLLFKPKVTALVGGEHRQFSSTLEVQNGNYSAAGDASYIDWRLENSARFALDDTRSLRLRSESFNTHEGAGSAVVPVNDPARFLSSTLDTSFEQALWGRRGQLVIDAGRLTKDYVETTRRPDFRDFEDRHVGGSFRFRVLPGADLQLQYRARDIDYFEDLESYVGEAVDHRETFTYLGASWERSLDLLGKLRIASGYKQTQNQAGQELADLSAWETNLRWQPRAAATFTFAADRSFREQFGLGAQGSISSYRYNWEQRWAKQLKTTLAGSYSRNLSGAVAREDEGRGIKLRLDYSYSTWVDMFVALGHDSRSTAGNLSFSQGTVMLGIAASFDRLFGK
jgi:hypothetical protein